MFIKAVIFDFNGTLFDDTEFHNNAWKKFALLHGKELSPQEIEFKIHGFTNREILHFIFDRELSIDDEVILYEEKENFYRELCKLFPEKCILTPGAEDFLNKLLEQNISRTIATASYLKNLELYFSLFNLSRWFTRDKVIYDTGEYRGKPYPDMFLAAAEKLGIPIGQCMVIEDSRGGVTAAKRAGAGSIIAISCDNKPGKFSQYDFIDQIITDFRHIDYTFK
jgi:beta-phosphoglucomutase